MKRLSVEFVNCRTIKGNRSSFRLISLWEKESNPSTFDWTTYLFYPLQLGIHNLSKRKPDRPLHMDFIDP